MADSAQSFCMLRLSWSLSFDIITSFIFGLDAGTNLLDDLSQIDTIASFYDDRYPAEAFWKKEAPWVSNVLTKCGWSPLGRNKRYQLAREYLEAWTLRMCSAANTTLDRAQPPLPESGAYPVVYAQIKKCVDDEYPILDSESKMKMIASELFDHLSSAHEVVGLMLAYTLRFIGENQTAQRKLREEVRRLRSKDLSALPSAATLGELHYLSAVISESFRMRPNGTPLPRITPHDRTVRLGEFNHIPGGVRVNTYQWFLHRDPCIWSDADKWVPERWLNHDGQFEAKSSHEPDRVLWPFCSGPRMCLGNHLTDYSTFRRGANLL
ncbi:hypothetical protein PFICI_00146 [Pestalotiopsis fici W106-1]|uniref:Uncharacterized protein n=1 Tax=Pestalotiopsis fici (strain W106-1 / CGMCC3.15140) TaxID=1229662 RepID=W3XJV6_PESFW|nr:uncharacterized protein PFICI_00146 [Pestalotiopsis fici W106-1]ETS86318.1 hypothetical protein PFICI_00146 [Pestalotiopsis fici W106-1]